jgi:glycosyltransferase involved in cell wall biosynthesis
MRYSGVPAERVTVIYNAIDERLLDRQMPRPDLHREFRLPEGTRIALYAGRLAGYKGIDVLLRAFSGRAAPRDTCLLVAGSPDYNVPGTRELMEMVESHRGKVDKRASIRFLGRREDVIRLMSGADVLVHPARTEAFGLVLVEALAAGLPVVASNVDGVPEVLQNTRSILVEPGDPTALGRATEAILNRDEAEKQAGQRAGRRRAKEFLSGTRADKVTEFANS